MRVITRRCRGSWRTSAQSGLFLRLAEQHAVALRRSALAQGSSVADAADLVQEVFEQALRARPPVRNDTELRGWLLIVLRHLWVDKNRSVAARRSMCCDVLTIPAPEPEAIPLWRLVDIEVVYAMLPRLSLPLRRAFELRLAGHSLRHIADRLEIPEATAGVQLHRARQRLKKLVLTHYQGERSETEGKLPPGRFVPYVVPPSNDLHQEGIDVPKQRNAKRRAVIATARNGVERGNEDIRGSTPTARGATRALPGSVGCSRL